MPWQILAAINVIGSSGYLLLSRAGLKDGKHDPTTYAIGVTLLTGLCSFIYAIALGSPNFDYGQIAPLHLFISFAANTLQFLLIAKALSLTEAGPFSILINVRTIFMIAFGAIFLDESITLSLAIGAALILIGATVVHYRKGQSFALRQGEIYTLAATLFFAIPFSNDAYILSGGYDVASYLTFAFTAPGLALGFIYPKALKRLVSTPFKKIATDMLPPALSLSTAVVVIFMAFQQTSNSSVLAAIAQSAAVFTVIGAALFLGERDHLTKKAIATAVVFIGLVIVNL